MNLRDWVLDYFRNRRAQGNRSGFQSKKYPDKVYPPDNKFIGSETSGNSKNPNKNKLYINADMQGK